MKRTGLAAGISILLAFFNISLAQGLGEILPNDIAQSADVSVLESEAGLFNTIKKGVALSLALCEGTEPCNPAVNRDELEQIISTLDARIGNIGQRYEQSGDKSLEGLLVAYADARDSYTQYLEILGKYVKEEPESTADLFGRGGDFFGGASRGAGAADPFSIFNDADQDLSDDVDVDDEDSTGAGSENTESPDASASQ